MMCLLPRSCVTLLLMISVCPLTAQYQNIRVGEPINPGEPQEPSIVMNPNNTNLILVGSNTDNYYYSTNAGLTWQNGILSSSFGAIGDPCVLVDETDNYYYFHLVPDLSRVVCQKSTSLGNSWSNGTFTGVNGTKENDKEWATIDRGNGMIYLTWAQFDVHGSPSPLDSSEIRLSRSTDRGLSWSTPAIISDKKGDAAAGNYSDHAPMPAIGLHHEVYVAWMGPEGLMFDKSTDDGLTWLDNDVNVSGSHIRWLLFNIPGVSISPGFPIMNCDLSLGTNRGSIYICWTDQQSGTDDTDVWLVKSTDGGVTWSSRIRVNDDPPGRHQFFAWMTVDQTNGYLYFVFYDRRNHSSTATDVFMALSTDGGTTFSNFMVSESPFTPSQSDYLGHYIGVSAHSNIVRPVWTRIDNHFPSLWTAIIDSTPTVSLSSRPYIPSDFLLAHNFPNPFNSSTTIRYAIPQSSNVVIKVFDILGREIDILKNEEQTAAAYEITWHAKDIPSGIYFYQLRAGSFVETKKLLLMR